MADVFSAGIYVQPMDFFPLALGGGSSQSAAHGAGAGGTGGDKKKFEALQQQQFELSNQRVGLENALRNAKYGTMLAIKRGEDPTAALNRLNEFLLKQYYPAINAQDANEALATRRKEEATEFSKEVRAKGADKEPLLENRNGYYDLKTDPTTGRVMTMGSYEGFLNQLSWTDNPQYTGLYAERSPDGKPILDADGKPVMHGWDYDFPNVPEPKQNVFENELIKNVDVVKGIYDKEFGGGPGNMSKIGESYLLPSSEWEKSTNAKQLQMLGDRMFQSLSTPAKEQIARDFWRDGLAGFTMVAKWTSVDAKTKKVKTETGEKPILDMKRFEEVINERSAAQKSGDPDAIKTANEKYERFLGMAQTEYALARIWGKVDPAVSVQFGSKSSVQNLGNLEGNSGKDWTWFDSFDNPKLAIAENIWSRQGNFVTGITDEKGSPVPVVRSPIINQDEEFQGKFYKPALQNLFTNKGIVLKGNVNGKEMTLATITDQEALGLNNRLIQEFTKANPGADWGDNQTKTLYAAWRTEKYNEYIYNKMNMEGKELMINGSTYKDINPTLDESNSWSVSKMGTGAPIPQSDRVNPTWAQAYGKVAPRSFPMEMTTPIGDIPNNVRDNSNMTGQQLDEDEDIYLGGSYIKPFSGTAQDRVSLANSGGDKPPVVVEIIRGTPTMPARDKTLHPGAESDIVVDPERLKYMTIYYDGETYTLDDEKIQAKFGIRKQNLNQTNLRPNAKTALSRAGYADKEEVAIIPGWVEWKTFDVDRRYNTSDADARNRANETMQINQNAFYNQQQQQAEKAKTYETK